jgi:hypothetical protein
MPTRNQIAEALLARLSGAYAFVTASRRNRDPKRIGTSETPCLILLEHEEEYERQSAALPPIRASLFIALIYIDVGNDENAIPAATMNSIRDAIDAALVPDDDATGRQTLGGIVHSCMVDGVVELSSGDLTGKAAATIPIRVVTP